MTFAEFQATGRDAPDLGAFLRDFGIDEPDARGRIYLKSLFLEDTSTWPETLPGKSRGRWYTLIGRSEFESDDLAEIERTLYRFAISEGYITPDPNDPITDEPRA